MSRIEFPKKPRKDGSTTLFQTKDGSQVFVGKDYALQNEIDETKKKTAARSCFTGCRTCGACANSRRDCANPKSYDTNAGRMIDCRGCEKFRFHDCHNGLMRDSQQNPEEFTEDAKKLMGKTGKPLI